MLKKTTIGLGISTAILWMIAVGLAGAEMSHPQIEPIRAVFQGLAVTVTMSGVFAILLRVFTPVIVDRIDAARRRAIVISSYGADRSTGRATAESAQITMELPKQMATVGGRSQAYWDALADMSETLLGPRDDDPEPRG